MFQLQLFSFAAFGGRGGEAEKEMAAKNIQMYCGSGSGRSAAAIGQGIRCACAGKTVFVVRFLKGKASLELDYLKKLEPEIKLFCFDKFDAGYSDLTDEEKEEEKIHIQNGIGYAKKVLVTHECDMLILDEITDLVAMHIVGSEEVAALLEAVGEDMTVIMTGTARCEELWPYVDRVTEVSTLKADS